MFSSSSESLIQQARCVSPSDLQLLFNRLLKLLQVKEAESEAVDPLQRLRLILSVSPAPKRLPPDLHSLLSSLLFSPLESSQVLSSVLLGESLPPDGQKENCRLETLRDGERDGEKDGERGDINVHAAALLLSQAGSRAHLSSICTHLLRGLESRTSEAPPPALLHTLPLINSLLSHAPDVLSEDHVTLLSKKLVDWLRYASIVQGGGASSGRLFRTRQPPPLCEVDGGVSADFFSVLCVAQSFSGDQWMNVYSFSLLRHWLIAHAASTTDTDDRSEVEGSVVSMVSATSSSSRLLPPKERLREKSFQYCQRVLEQSDRKALKKSDSELQKACVVEAVCVLDCVCVEDVSLVFRSFPFIKSLFGRLGSDLSFARVLLPVAQFYLNHAETAAVDSAPVWALLFGRYPADLFSDALLAHMMLRFIRHNLDSLKTRVPTYTHSFPNLLKFLAWDSLALLEDFLDVLPSLVTPGTAVELLHSLLDLPCLTATLQLQLRSSCLPISDPGGRSLPLLDAFRSPAYRGLFLFLLREEAGSGDTMDRLDCLLRLLAEASCWPRVLHCSLAVPVLLHVFFHAVTAVADEKLLSQLVVVMLERSSLLLNIPSYITQIHKVFSCHLLSLFKLRPSLVVDQSQELLEFAGTTANVYSKEEVYTHVVWVLGEYLSVSCDPRCSVGLITSCFEALEAVLFEVTSSAPPPGASSPAPKVVTTLMSALAKLASRSHDLIPRVSLFLSKLRTLTRGGSSVSWCPDEEDLVAVGTRGEELWSLLKTPGVAQSVLTPPSPASPRGHRDTNVATPLMLRSITGLTHKQ